jgi:hypothetical protein
VRRHRGQDLAFEHPLDRDGLQPSVLAYFDARVAFLETSRVEVRSQ